MLHNEARNPLVEAYKKTHNAKEIALVYGVSIPTVYRLLEQKVKTGNVDLRICERGRKPILGQEALTKEGFRLSLSAVCMQYPHGHRSKWFPNLNDQATGK